MRHAQTAAPGMIHGAESDIGLSELGHRQALAAADHFSTSPPDIVISSAMLRARLTAEPIVQACRLDWEIEPLFHERKVGALSQTRIAAETNVWRETLRRWAEGDTGFAPPDTESFDAIRERLLPAWDRVTERHADKTILLVVHGAVIKVLLLSLLKGRSAADWMRIGPVENMAVSELIRDGSGWQPGRLLHVPERVRLAVTG
jgi:broad specificity phosphatase PhoE